MKRLFALLAALILCLPSAGMAEISWPAPQTGGQRQLIDYTARVNELLAQLGLFPVINSLFECYTYTASLGITSTDDAETPEGVEFSFSLYSETLNSLVLRVNDPSRFTAIASACIAAAASDGTTVQDARSRPAALVKRVQKAPHDSYHEDVNELNGEQAHAYFAYYPDQYHDGVNWLEMTLVFPMAGSTGGGVLLEQNDSAPKKNVEYEGYQPSDDASHLDVFLQATPEPDSPAGQQASP